MNRVLDVLNSFDLWVPSHFGLISPKKGLFEKNVEIIKKQGLKSSTVAGYVTSKPKSTSDYEHLQLDDAALLFEGRVYSPVPKTAVTGTSCQRAATLRSHSANNNRASRRRLLIPNAQRRLDCGRKRPIGVQPLYYGENRDIAAFATNRTALWKLGIENPISFPPGNLAFVNKEGFKFKPVKTLTYQEPKPITMDDAGKTTSGSS